MIVVTNCCTCGCVCDYETLGNCDGPVKPIGVRDFDKTWIHVCRAHRHEQEIEGCYFPYSNIRDWDFPGPKKAI